jgi:hypothetical protein
MLTCLRVGYSDGNGSRYRTDINVFLRHIAKVLFDKSALGSVA